jgi:DNA helicase-2/ATP-dependent DNA helicase PcrA
LGLRLLRRYGHFTPLGNDFVIYDATDSLSLAKRVIKRAGIDLKEISPRDLLRVIDNIKNVSPNKMSTLLKREDEIMCSLVRSFNAELLEAKASDFGDLIYKVVDGMGSSIEIRNSLERLFDFILVDEFQDTNEVQYELICGLARKHRNLFVVGDDDQSIYAFRGASLYQFKRFQSDFPESKVVLLEQNYRSTQSILAAANAVMRASYSSSKKRLWSDSPIDFKLQTFVGFTPLEEARFLASEIKRLFAFERNADIAIFYRTNAQSRSIEEALVRERIGYAIFGGTKFYDRTEIKDALAYFKLLIYPFDKESFLRVINVPSRKIGEKSLSTFFSDGGGDTDLIKRALAAKSPNIRLFGELIQRMRIEAESMLAGDLLISLLKEANYLDYLNSRSNKDPSDALRLDNVNELIQVVKQLDLEVRSTNPGATTIEVIKILLDRSSLTGGDDGSIKLIEENRPPVRLTTLHLAKGLEFDNVFLTGLEEGILPHFRSLQEGIDALEEERRLFYVGVTRAKKRLYLTRSMDRGMNFYESSYNEFGQRPSRFLADIPDELYVEVSSSKREELRLKRSVNF